MNPISKNKCAHCGLVYGDWMDAVECCSKPVAVSKCGECGAVYDQWRDAESCCAEVETEQPTENQ